MRGQRIALHFEGNLLEQLADAYLGVGDLERARVVAEVAIAHAHRGGILAYLPGGYLALARVLRAQAGVAAREQIEQALADAEKAVTELKNSAQTPRIHEERAELARLLSDDATCKRELREAHRLFVEMGATGHAERLAKELGL